MIDTRAAAILVLGGAGFLGRQLVPKLDAAGHRVTVPTRRRERARHLILLPKIDVVQADVHDDAALDRLLSHQDIVINLVGILHGRLGEPYGPDFGKAHVELMARTLRIAATRGVTRLIQVSALGVTDNAPATAPSRYLRSKAAAEELLKASTLDWTILRPSVMFGRGDRFLTTFATLQRFLPFVALPNPDARFQPIHVGDVADAIVTCVATRATIGQTFELAGPQVFTLAELVRMAGRWSGHPRPVIGVPPALGHLQALMMEKLPGPTLMSRDNLLSMKVDNVATEPADPLLGLMPAPIEAIAPGYLAPIDSPFNAERRARR